jgi:hypothetical protein
MTVLYDRFIRGLDDTNVEIDENDFVVVETRGSKVGKQGAGLVGSEDPADAGAGAKLGGGEEHGGSGKGVDEGNRAEGEGQ